MRFSIVENIKNHNAWDSVKGIFKFLILIVRPPILLISGLIGFFYKEKEIANVNEWTEFYSNVNFKLNRIFRLS
jgi:hypothetical protein